MTGGNIHLKVMVDGGGTDIVEKDGWVKVTEKGLSQVSLTCTAQLFPAGGIVPLHSSVFWRKVRWGGRGEGGKEVLGLSSGNPIKMTKGPFPNPNWQTRKNSRRNYTFEKKNK